MDERWSVSGILPVKATLRFTTFWFLRAEGPQAGAGMRFRPRGAAALATSLLASIVLPGTSDTSSQANSLPLSHDAVAPGPILTHATFPDQVYTIGGNPYSVAGGDFNADGFQD